MSDRATFIPFARPDAGEDEIAVNSASAGLHLAVEGLDNGVEAIVPLENCSYQAGCFIVATHQEHEPGPGIRG